MGLVKGTVILEEYNSKWKDMFLNTKIVLENIFKEEALEIEHIGSTSVEDLKSKPVIEILIGVNQLKNIDYYKDLFKDYNDYNVRDYKDNDEVLVVIEPNDITTHLIHITDITSSRYIESILFRNYLKDNKDILLDYQKLKEELALKYKNDRKVYTASKNDFIKNIINKAYQVKSTYEDVLNDKYIINIYNKIKDYEDNSNNAYAYHDLTHALNVSDLAVSILTELKYSYYEIEAIKIACLLHDIGCLEGKDDHEIKGYNLALKYLENKNIVYKERILNSIKNHRIGFDSNDILTTVLVLCDKLDIKKTRIAPSGTTIEGNRQYLFIEDIKINIINNEFIVDFIVDDKCDIKEMEEYYFTKKVFKAIGAFANKFNLKPVIYMNGKKWNIGN